MSKKWKGKQVQCDAALTIEMLAGAAEHAYNRVGTVYYEMHADGVKEVREECPFCKPSFCEMPHCPYTEEEQ